MVQGRGRHGLVARSCQGRGGSPVAHPTAAVRDRPAAVQGVGALSWDRIGLG